jgi:single-strand DNA-binding protein
MNKYIALGNLVKDPVTKQTKTNKTVCSFTIAVNGSSDKTLYIDIETWNSVAENCSRFLSKGRKVLIEGRLNMNSWTSKEGEKRTKITCTADFVNFISQAQKDPPSQTDSSSPSDEQVSEDEFADIPF